MALPGYLFTVLYADKIGLRRLQLGGFAATAFFFLLLALLQPYLVQQPALYVILYGLTFFFQNFGANSTTYIIPSLIYSTEYRATCHGISAAAGKLGAILGAQVKLLYKYLQKDIRYYANLYFRSGNMSLVISNFQAFLFLIGSFCNNGVCGVNSPAEQVNAGLRVTFSVCGILALIG